MYSIIKQFLFFMSAEKAHHFTTSMLSVMLKVPGMKSILQAVFVVKDKALERQLFGLTFPNPVGLAAGFDKNAEFIHDFQSFGFGFIEIGTLTPKAQPGNPKPRLFRLVEDGAVINRMGFNNDGVDNAVERLKKRPGNLIVGGNIGKNKITPNEEATSDYLKCYEALFPYVDYFVVNVSSPNTPDLRALQDKEPLMELISTLKKRNDNQETPKPILLKIAPDLTNEQLDDILEIADSTKLDGLIATNTTISRDGLSTDPMRIEEIGAGGLSGAPLTKRSTEVIAYLRNKNSEIPIIGVGGIVDEKSALEKINAGANLLQIYSGFIFEGPGLIKRINKALLK
ncbi:MAG: quinone-dependent dihydroorotate dehydrogenase [Cyclobacteriaceae bacterium]